MRTCAFALEGLHRSITQNEQLFQANHWSGTAGDFSQGITFTQLIAAPRIVGEEL